MSWIALDDLLALLLRAIADDRLAGPVNAVAPDAVSNHVFAETLGSVLGRPAVLRTPAAALRLVAGELADELVLASQRARPARLEEVGFTFAFPTLEDALRQELGRYDRNRGAEISASSLRSTVQPGHSR
jgi:NAD dependent epimerase/dehydratase family enzyme